MLDAYIAKKIGISACIEKIGVEFYRKYTTNACVSCGRRNDIMFCSVGVDDKTYKPEENPQKLMLTENGFQYIASCNVDMNSRNIEFLECVVPPISV